MCLKFDPDDVLLIKDNVSCRYTIRFPDQKHLCDRFNGLRQFPAYCVGFCIVRMSFFHSHSLPSPTLHFFVILGLNSKINREGT